MPNIILDRFYYASFTDEETIDEGPLMLFVQSQRDNKGQS